MLTTVMYHYVRDLKNSRYPAIKGLDVELFKSQIGYLKQNYKFVSVEDVCSAARGGKTLPNNSVLLTFDDGYSDHFNFVFPILKQEGIKGAFFAPRTAICDHIVLDVNKIHFTLASTPDEKLPALMQEIRVQIEKYRKDFSLETFEEYYCKYAQPNRFDCAEVSFVKRLLQFVLPEQIRSLIADRLFQVSVGVEEGVFSRELYMNVDQIKCMIADGMHFGGHGVGHFWLGTLDPNRQETEIKGASKFLDFLGMDKSCRSFAYPFGSYNDETLSLMKKYGFVAGFTTKVEVLEVVDATNLLLIPRQDTNDIPKK